MAIILNDNIEIRAPKPAEERLLTTTLTSYANIAAVNAAIVPGRRYLGLTVRIGDDEYHYHLGVGDSDLVIKTTDLSGYIPYTGGGPVTGNILFANDVYLGSVSRPANQIIPHDGNDLSLYSDSRVFLDADDGTDESYIGVSPFSINLLSRQKVSDPTLLASINVQRNGIVGLDAGAHGRIQSSKIQAYAGNYRSSMTDDLMIPDIGKVNDLITAATGSIDLTPYLKKDGSVVMTGTLITPGVDVAATAGSDVLSIGVTNANVINYGNSSTVHNFFGTAVYEYQTNAYITDKLFTLNSGGGTATGGGSGFEIEENAIITGYIKSSAARTGFDFKSPSTAGITTLITGASARTLTVGNTGTIAVTSDLSSYLLLTGGTLTGSLLINASSSQRIDTTSSANNLNLGTTTANGVVLGRTGQNVTVQCNFGVTGNISNGNASGGALLSGPILTLNSYSSLSTYCGISAYDNDGLGQIDLKFPVTISSNYSINILGASGNIMIDPGSGTTNYVLTYDSTLTGALKYKWAAASGLTSSLTNGHIFVGNGSGVATDVAMSGVIAITNAGVTSFASSTGTAGTAVVLATSPTLVTPNIGVATGTSLSLSGAGGAGFMGLAKQTSNPASSAGSATKLFANTSGYLSWKLGGTTGDNFVRLLNGVLTADRTYTLPDASITLIGDGSSVSALTITNAIITALSTSGVSGSSSYLQMADNGVSFVNSTQTFSTRLTAANSTADRIINIPDSNGTLALTSQLFTSPLTTKGDIMTFDSAVQRLGIGTNGYVLTADSTQATGLKWAAGGGDMVLASIQTVTGAKTFNSSQLILAGSTSGTTTLNAAATAGSGTVVLPTTGTLATLAGSEALTNKTYNGNTWTAGTATLTLAGNLITTGAFNTTFAQAATTTVTLPSTSSTMARTDAGQTFTGTQILAAGTTAGSQLRFVTGVAPTTPTSGDLYYTTANGVTFYNATNNYAAQYTDGTRTFGFYLGTGTTGTLVGSVSNHAFGLFANNGSASLIVNANGTVSIPAVTSISPSVAAGGGGSLAIIRPTTTQQAFITIQTLTTGEFFMGLPPGVSNVAAFGAGNSGQMTLSVHSGIGVHISDYTTANTAPTAQLQVTSIATSKIGFRVAGFLGQTADLLQLYSSSTKLTYADNLGRLFITDTTAATSNTAGGAINVSGGIASNGTSYLNTVNVTSCVAITLQLVAFPTLTNSLSIKPSSGLNNGGTTLVLAAGAGTGNSNGSIVSLQTSTPTTSGSTVQTNAARMVIDSFGVQIAPTVDISQASDNSLVNDAGVLKWKDNTGTLNLLY